MVNGLPSKQRIWVRFPLLAVSIYGTQYYNKLQQFLIYKGKKSVTENLFRSLLVSRAQKKKSTLISESTRCKHNSTLFLRLKTRKRGKRVLYRVTYLEKGPADKKAFCTFGKYIRKLEPENLELALEKEIEGLAKDRSHPVRVERDRIHRLARRHGPQS